MTTPNPEGVAAGVAGVDATAAATNAANDTDAHTPDPPVVPPAEKEKSTDASQGEGLAALRETVATLGNTVDALAQAVNGVLEKDTSPTSRVPWTHRFTKPKA